MGQQQKNLYNSRQWRKVRLNFLDSHPICKMCRDNGIIAAATVVDHIKQHNNNLSMFWDETNFQALCKLCHDSHKQRYEKSGLVMGCDSNGIPDDPGHHWNK